MPASLTTRFFHTILTGFLVPSMLLSSLAPRPAAPAQGLPRAGQTAAADAADLHFSLRDALIDDQDGDGKAGAGDTLRYTLELENPGLDDLSGVQIEDALPGLLTLLPGSLRSTPLAYPAALNTAEDTPLAITLQGHDPDGDPLTYTVTDTSALAGSLNRLTGPGVTFAPTDNFLGDTSFTFEVCDPSSACAEAQIQINVGPVNDAPGFTAGTPVTVLEDAGPQTVTGWASAISPGPADEAGQLVTFELSANSNPDLFASAPAISSNGTLAFTPAANASGSATLSVAARDDGGTAAGGVDTSAPQTLSITVTPVNDAPGFSGAADVSVPEDSGAVAIPGWISAMNPGPADEAGQVLSASLVETTTSGLFAIAPVLNLDTGELTFTPRSNASGSAEFEISLSDDGGTANGGSDTSAIRDFTITVTPVNDAPSFTKGGDVSVLEDAGAQVVNDWATAISAGAGDTGQALTFVISGNTNPGLFASGPSVSASGRLSFEPIANANGSATVTLQLQDDGGTGGGGADTSAPQSFTITVTAVNDAPGFTSGGDISVLEDAGAQTFSGWMTALTAGPADEAGQALSFVIQDNSNPGLFSDQPHVAADGTVTFTAKPGASGTAEITLTIQDDGGTANGGTSASPEQSFNITVQPVNDAPAFVKGIDVTVDEDSGAYGQDGWATGITPGSADESGQGLTFEVTGSTNPGLFSVAPSVSAAGRLTFTPAANANGKATLSIRLVDDGGTANGGADVSAEQVFTIQVEPVNDAPSFSKGADVTVLEDSGQFSQTNWADDISAGPTDETGQTLVFSVSTDNAALFLAAPALSADGRLTFTPAVNANGSAIVTVTIADDGGTAHGGVDTSPSQTFTITVTPVNDAPTLAAGSITIAENLVNGEVVGVTAGADVDTGQVLVHSITAGNTGDAFQINPATGQITVKTSAQLDYEAVPGHQFTLTVKVEDDQAPKLSASADITITLTNVNEAPQIGADSFETVGNTLLEVHPTNLAAAQPAPVIFFQGSLLANDSDPENDALTAALSTKSTNAQVTVNPNGSFTYLPPPGTATDSFTYTLSDGELSSTGTVSLTMKGEVWYVRNNAPAGGLGRSTDPFDTLAEADTSSAANDIVYVYVGDGATTGQNTGITLESGQQLIGAGVALSAPVSVNGGPNPTPLLDAGTAPEIGSASGNAVILISPANITVSGLDITANTNAIYYSGSANGTVLLTHNTIHNTSLHGISLESTSYGSINTVISDTTFSTIAGRSIHLVHASGNKPTLQLENLALVGQQGALYVDNTGFGNYAVTEFSNITVSASSGGPAITLNDAVFDATPGGSYQLVQAGSLVIGPNNIQGAGLVMANAQGDLSFTNLVIKSGGGAALQAASPNDYSGSVGLQLTSAAAASTTLEATGGPALDLSKVTINLQVSKLTCSSSPTRGISLDQVKGTLNHTNAASSDSLSNITGSDLYMFGGDADVTYKGSITSTAGRSVEVTGRTGGTLTLTGAITDSGTGISLTNNTTSTLLFSGGLNLTTSNNAAFTATNTNLPAAGSLAVTGANNTITTSTGQPLKIQNVPIAAADVTFRSISANGASVGIQVENTGTSGNFVVTGSSGSGTGGTIQNVSGDGILLRSTLRPELYWINLTDTAQIASTNTGCPPGSASCSAAVKLSAVSGAVLDGLSITSSGKVGETYPILVNNPTGAVLIEDTSLSQLADDALRVYQDIGLSNLTLRRITINNPDATLGEDGIQILATGTADLRALVDFAEITELDGDGLDAASSGTANLHLTVQNSKINQSKGMGIQAVSGFASHFLLNINANEINNSLNTALNLAGYGTTATLQAIITNNTMTHGTVSGIHEGYGVRIIRDDASQVTALVQGNTISNTGHEGVLAVSRENSSIPSGSHELSLKFLENTVGMPENDATEGVRLLTSNAQAKLCLNVTDAALPKNNLTGNVNPGIKVNNASGGNFKIQGLAGFSDTDVANYLTAQLASSPPAAAVSGTTSFTSGTCAEPTVPTLPTAALSGGPAVAAAAPQGRAPGLAALARPASFAAGETLAVDIPRLPAGASLTLTFDVRIASPLPAGTAQVANQAVVTADGGGSLLSDDPDTGAANDATVTGLYMAPLATADTYTTVEDTPLTVAAPGLLENDWHAPGESLTAGLVAGPARGTLLLNADGSFTYTPAPDDAGPVTFRYQAEDGAHVSAPAEVTITITPVNDAPRLDPSGEMSLTPVVINDTNPAGMGIAALLASAGGDRVTDPDDGALEGIAVTAADSAHGAWQYSLDSGAAWLALGPISHSAARLLAADAATRVRFVPAPDWSGSLSAALTFRVWDRTSGANGGTADVTTNGGSTAFSTQTETVALTVVNQVDVSLETFTLPTRVLSGSTAALEATAVNHGPAPASGLTLTVTLPDGAAFAAGPAGCIASGSLVTCDLGGLAVSQSRTVRLTIGFAAGVNKTLRFTGTLQASEPDALSGNNSAAAETEAVTEVVVYNLPEEPGEEWSEPTITEPDCGDSFLGEFSNETVTLGLENLPEHSQAVLTFDLHIIRSWDGNASYWPAAADQASAASGPIGPDVWQLRADGSILVDTTFSNWDDQAFRQAYPGSSGTGDYPPRTGAAAVDSLCYRFAGQGMDTTYRFSIPISHAASDLTIDFTALGLQDLADESWGLSNVQVSLSGGLGPKPVRIFIPALMR